jgi:hypothetical protein
VLYTPTPTPAQQQQLRHRCRNPRCGCKLKTPTDSPHRAFCCRGCFDSDYRARCLVCERPIERKTERRRFCSRSACRHEFRSHPEQFYDYPHRGSVYAANASRNPIKSGLKIGSKVGRPFRIVAGPEITGTSFRLATIPLDPGLTARLERAHADFFNHRRKARARGADQAPTSAGEYPRRLPVPRRAGGRHEPDRSAGRVGDRVSLGADRRRRRRDRHPGFPSTHRHRPCARKADRRCTSAGSIQGR